MKNIISMDYYDYIVVGAGIVGLTIARQLSAQKKDARILVIEKESSGGQHASGRNSGVLHSGIYYPENTLKSKVCLSGAKLMSEYCFQHGLPIQRLGKVIVTTKESDNSTLDQLIKNAIAGNLSYEEIGEKQLNELEPHAKSVTGRALYIPDVSVVDSKRVLEQVTNDLDKSGVKIHYNETLISADIENSKVTTSKKNIKYGFLINASGQYADKIAQMFGVGKQFSILPFKGSYYKLRKDVNTFSNGLIYPAPDLSRPFLGIHTVKDTKGDTYFGPTAVPVFGRENYSGVKGVELCGAYNIIYYLSKMYIVNNQNFRNYAHHEALNSWKNNFVKSAQMLVNNLKKQDLLKSNKSGIRPQLFDKNKNELVMDLKIEVTENTLHILNAISPAFTASFSFAELVVNHINRSQESLLEKTGVIS